MTGRVREVREVRSPRIARKGGHERVNRGTLHRSRTVFGLFTAVAVVSATIALGAAFPAVAGAADSVGVASLQVSSLAPSATEVTYTVSFVATDGLTADYSTVTLAAPTGTTFVGDGSSTCSVYYVYDDTTGASSSCETPTASGSSVTIQIETRVGAGDEVTLVADGVTNDSSTGAQNLELSTSSDPTAVSLSYTLSSAGKVGAPNYSQSSYTASATDVTDTASLVSTDGLTSGNSTITLAAPSGTVFPGTAGEENCDYAVYDWTTYQSSGCVFDLAFANSDATVTFPSPIRVGAGDEITVVVTGVDNAPSAGTLDISTSSDPSPESVSTGSATSSPASLQLSSYAPSATGTIYQANFTTSHGLTTSSTITLTAPSGTVFSSNVGDDTYCVIDDSTHTAECNPTLSGTGTDSVTITSPVNAAAGAEVTVVISGTTNDSSSASQDLTLSDSADGTLGSLPYTLSSSGKIADVSVEPDSLTPSANHVTYTTTFVATDAPSNGYSDDLYSITLAAPSGTVFPSSICDYQIIDDTTQTSSGCVPPVLSNSDATVNLVSGYMIGHRGDIITVITQGVKNDSSKTAQSVDVSTTADPGTVASPTYTLSSAGSVSGVGVQLSSHAEKAKDVTYSVTVDSTDGMTPDQSTIKLTATKGTVFDVGTGGGNLQCGIVYFYDQSSGQTTGCVDLASSGKGATMTVTVPYWVAPGDAVTVLAEGVTNASSAKGTLKVSTSSDTKAVTVKYTLR